MSERPRVLLWNELKEGMTVSLPFRIGQSEMDAFRKLSGDSSRIHIDSEFAQSRGFTGPVVYGALTVARLSHLVGMHLPGDLGLATSWRIDFNKPLYIDEEATFNGELTHVSQSTHTVSLKFRVYAGEKLIASGTAGSKLLDE
ncbi:MaoC/PaaZ C-terminal domain-containing protein [Bradyrhizobium sp. B120]|uniref:MaoC/PaaZ C-terminal domain-containing protein n=1 Tax=Bradyrhizobium sp. B120 TaxID=3410088 RepID=UPI003B97E5F2